MENLRVFPNGSSREYSLELILRNKSKGKVMLEITIKKIYSSYSEETIREAISEAKTKIHTALVELCESDTICHDDFVYHFGFNAQYRGIRRVAKRHGMDWRDLNALINYFYPEGLI